LHLTELKVIIDVRYRGLSFCLWLGELDETIGFAWLLADAAYAGGFVYQSTASFGGRGPNEWTLG
jgi:hypothetical protein